MRIPRIYDPKLVPELGSSLTLDDFGTLAPTMSLRSYA